jgi:hypothetical protein
MLRNIFKTREVQKKRSSKNPKDMSPFISSRDGITEQKVMQGAERELYQYDRAQQDLGMSDLIKLHEPGHRFLYAAVTGKEHEDVPSLQRRLKSFKPRLNKKSFPIDTLPNIPLFRETEVFPLVQVLPNRKKHQYGDYLRISDAVVLYGAVVSPSCNFTKILIGINDNRLLRDKMVKSFQATTNIEARGNLKLPYCIPVNEADQLQLTVSREQAFLEDGFQWGAIRIQLTLEFTDFPVQYENQEVSALNMITPSTLETPKTNPDFKDISILNNDRSKLADMYLDGDIADETEPVVNRSETVKYAKSSIMGTQKGKKMEAAAPDWSFINGKRIQINEDQNSVELEDDSSMLQEYKEEPSANHIIPPHELRSVLKNGNNKSPFTYQEEETESTEHVPLVRHISDEFEKKKTVGFNGEVSNGVGF